MPEPGSPLARTLKRHLEPSLAMLEEEIRICPDHLWAASDAGGRAAPIWEHLYHTLFWLMAWLRDWDTPLERPAFHVEEALDLKPAPAAAVSRDQMAMYCAAVRAACVAHLDGLARDAEVTAVREAFGKQWSVEDRALGQIRHVQHHVGYINALLSSHGARAVGWKGYNE